MERNSNLITCPITEELREELGITEDSILEAHYADEEIIISVVDEDEYETVDLNEVEESGDLEGSYTLGRLAGQLDGFKEGYAKQKVSRNTCACITYFSHKRGGAVFALRTFNYGYSRTVPSLCVALRLLFGYIHS